MKIRLSPHFTVNEAQRSEIARNNNIANVMPADCYKGAVELALNVLEPIREKFGIFSPLSWYRCPELNKLVGGSLTSGHLKGEAVDIIISGVPLIELAKFIRDNLNYDQLILEKGWVHVSFSKENRKEDLTKIANGYRRGIDEIS